VLVTTQADELYERIAPVVSRMVWLYLATDPERDDIAQDILISVLRRADTLRDPGSLEAWASRVAFNRICNLFRARKLRRWLSLEMLSDAEPPAPEADFEGRELLARTQRILERLPVAERMPFTLQMLAGASVEQIAAQCGWSERTTRRRLKAARARFLRLVRLDSVLSARLAPSPGSTEGDSNG
jgi:RNA polymerase sigma factor (sigma-70 family)